MKKRRVVVHSADEIAGIREASRATAYVRDSLSEKVRPGMTTLEVDELAGSLIRETGGTSAFYNYRGFPGQVCISPDDVVVHGIGKPSEVVRPGQLLSIDIGVRIGKYIGDSAVTFCVGGIESAEPQRLMAVTRASLDAGIKAAKAGRRVNDIGRAVESVVTEAGYSVVRDYVGHGVGCELHEPPEVPNFSQRDRGPRMVPGMVLAIEPMVNAGASQVVVEEDGWTVRTADSSLSAHFEHTVLITADGPEILTWQKTV